MDSFASLVLMDRSGILLLTVVLVLKELVGMEIAVSLVHQAKHGAISIVDASVLKVHIGMANLVSLVQTVSSGTVKSMIADANQATSFSKVHVLLFQLAQANRFLISQ